MSQPTWRDRYVSLVPHLSAYAQRLPLTLCGLGTCTDAYLRLAEAQPLFEAEDGSPAASLADTLRHRAANGIGGEFRMHWPEAEEWIAENLPISSWGLGGTGAQAAQALTLLGASALISLEDRSRRQLSVIHPNVLVATGQGLQWRSSLSGSDQGKPAHYIFEFSAGERLGPVFAKRSTRVIVRFADDRLDRDPDFVRESIANAAIANAAVICGFNEIPDASLSEELVYTESLLSAWRAQGLAMIHLELGGYEHLALRDRVLSHLGPLVTSLGMSHSELLEFGSKDMVLQAAELQRTFGLSRVCVHADTWAMAVTQNEPEREFESLLCGCLLASCRAYGGTPSVPAAIPTEAVFLDPPYQPIGRHDGLSVVCCAAPYLERPKATIGLGDTFLAGTLLRLGIQQPI